MRSGRPHSGGRSSSTLCRTRITNVIGAGNHTRLFALFNRFRDDDDEALDVAEIHAAPEATQPEAQLLQSLDGESIKRAVAQLPLRQQQAFLLRSWEGLSVDDTATAMSCSTGSIKTHYSRAVRKLRALLQEGENDE